MENSTRTKHLNLDDAAQNTVRIYIGTHWAGMGVLLPSRRAESYILTAAHVLAQPGQYNFQWRGKRKNIGKSRTAHGLIDIAICKVDVPSDELVRISCCHASQGKVIHMIHSPAAGETVTSTGSLELASPIHFYYSPISYPGSSGSPIFDSMFHLVGVNIAMNTLRHGKSVISLGEGAYVTAFLNEVGGHDLFRT